MRTMTIAAVVISTATLAGAGWYGVEASAQARSEAEALAAVEAMYEVISGPAGQERDWDAFREMFTDDGRMSLFTRGRPAGGDGGVAGTGAVAPKRITWTPDEYIERAGAHMESNSFYEASVWDNVQVFGRMAHVFSTYETYNELGGRAVARGVNSIQLVKDPADEGSGWKVLLIVWDTETPERPVPAGMLPADGRAEVETED